MNAIFKCPSCSEETEIEWDENCEHCKKALKEGRFYGCLDCGATFSEKDIVKRRD